MDQKPGRGTSVITLQLRVTDDLIAAEVVPAAPSQAGHAARWLQERGFRVLHIGSTVSVEAGRDQWEETFGVTFTTRERSPSPTGRSPMQTTDT
jgi:hypothetical protein